MNIGKLFKEIGIVIAALAVVVLFGNNLSYIPEEESTLVSVSTNEKPSSDIDEPSSPTTPPVYRPTCPESDIASGSALLLPMSKVYGLGAYFVPPDLAPLPSWTVRKGQGTICLREEARDELVHMFTDAHDAGHNLQVTSGYRDYDYQTNLFQYYVITMGYDEAARVSASPGHSEHQLGTAVDMAMTGGPSTDHNLGLYPAGIWLAEHAPEYGFVMSYPEESEEVTGYIYEPWHFRYVGKDVADALDKNETLYEYLLELAEEETTPPETEAF